MRVLVCRRASSPIGKDTTARAKVQIGRRVQYSCSVSGDVHSTRCEGSPLRRDTREPSIGALDHRNHLRLGQRSPCSAPGLVREEHDDDDRYDNDAKHDEFGSGQLHLAIVAIGPSTSGGVDGSEIGGPMTKLRRNNCGPPCELVEPVGRLVVVAAATQGY